MWLWEIADRLVRVGLAECYVGCCRVVDDLSSFIRPSWSSYFALMAAAHFTATNQQRSRTSGLEIVLSPQLNLLQLLFSRLTTEAAVVTPLSHSPSSSSFLSGPSRYAALRTLYSARSASNRRRPSLVAFCDARTPRRFHCSLLSSSSERRSASASGDSWSSSNALCRRCSSRGCQVKRSGVRYNVGRRHRPSIAQSRPATLILEGLTSGRRTLAPIMSSVPPIS